MERCEAEGATSDLALVRECREAILAFWHYRYTFERGTRPFQQFEAAIATFAGRDPRLGSDSDPPSEIAKLLDSANGGLRALTEIAIGLEGKALSECISEQEIALAHAAVDAGQDGPDLTLLFMLLAEGKRFSSAEAQHLDWVSTRIAAVKELIASAEEVLRRASSDGGPPP